MFVKNALPVPSLDAQNASDALKKIILQKIIANHHWLPFADFMNALLYTPNLGYYAGGAHKFGASGDFITAPEISPLFAQCVAKQAAQIFVKSAANVLEIGAGSGQFALDFLLSLEKENIALTSYQILELSGELAARQRDKITKEAPQFLPFVTWISALPNNFCGLIFANEVVDAMPVHLFVNGENGVLERGVAIENSAQNAQFIWADKAPSKEVKEEAARLCQKYELPQNYVSEINLIAKDWLKSLANSLKQGAILLIDYGFSEREFYHPARVSGTLMCHYRHHSHIDPFYLPGLQDVTTHVDFTALANAAFASDLEVSAYTNQANFLINCGILASLEYIEKTSEQIAYAKTVGAVQKLISPAEMGELFKVILLTKNMDESFAGFTQNDLLMTL